ncbi:MAG: rhodanese-like domain-containing protein [Ignavibacteriaceae bacterium]|nr:rhodanese-like domain-containing protein [Ignavibacteriaceae bacterium]
MKKIIRKIFKIINIVFLTLVFHSCIDDNVSPPLTGNLNSTAELLVYFESLGDFANSTLAPALVEADEVYANINNYLIVDVRDNSDFLTGHIESAINVAGDSLNSFMESISTQNYQKIILVSKNGHASAYYTCLLRLLGFDNVYTLNFGMASWHLDFAEEWFSALENLDDFTDEQFPKNDFTNLPILNFSNPSASIEEKARERILLLLDTGFNYTEVYRSNFILFENELLVCYGTSMLYSSKLYGIAHKVGTIHYMSSPLYELRSVNYLQTLPPDKPILIYSFNGQLSACITAYLRTLGYDAKTLQFGANQIFYNNMFVNPELAAYAFDQSDIKNFPYVRGN